MKKKNMGDPEVRCQDCERPMTCVASVQFPFKKTRERENVHQRGYVCVDCRTHKVVEDGARTRSAKKSSPTLACERPVREAIEGVFNGPRSAPQRWGDEPIVVVDGDQTRKTKTTPKTRK